MLEKLTEDQQKAINDTIMLAEQYKTLANHPAFIDFMDRLDKLKTIVDLEFLECDNDKLQGVRGQLKAFVAIKSIPDMVYHLEKQAREDVAEAVLNEEEDEGDGLEEYK